MSHDSLSLKAPPMQSCTRPHVHQKSYDRLLPFHLSNSSFLISILWYIECVCAKRRIKYSEESLFAIELMCKDDLL